MCSHVCTFVKITGHVPSLGMLQIYLWLNYQWPSVCWALKTDLRSSAVPVGAPVLVVMWGHAPSGQGAAPAPHAAAPPRLCWRQRHGGPLPRSHPRELPWQARASSQSARRRGCHSLPSPRALRSHKAESWNSTPRAAEKHTLTWKYSVGCFPLKLAASGLNFAWPI